MVTTWVGLDRISSIKEIILRPPLSGKVKEVLDSLPNTWQKISDLSLQNVPLEIYLFFLESEIVLQYMKFQSDVSYSNILRIFAYSLHTEVKRLQNKKNK